MFWTNFLPTVFATFFSKLVTQFLGTSVHCMCNIFVIKQRSKSVTKQHTAYKLNIAKKQNINEVTKLQRNDHRMCLVVFCFFTPLAELVV